MAISKLLQAAEKPGRHGIDLIPRPEEQNNRQEQQRSAAAPRHRAECQQVYRPTHLLPVSNAAVQGESVGGASQGSVG